MEIYATRSSVAAGDDVFAPHAQTFAMPDGSPIEDVLAHIQKEGYLAELASGNACWSVASNVPIAVLAQKWTEAQIIFHFPNELEIVDGVLRLQFNYHGQIEPEVVQKILSDFRTKAIKA